MATGSGKTYTAANVAYRLVRYGDAKRILFLVDRANLGRQTLKEFQSFSRPTTAASSRSSTTSSISPVTRLIRSRE
jgi:type I restriction enzyme R subunit